MKSKQELIDKWESAIEAAEFYGKGKEERLISYMKDFVSDLNQLDEPETVEQTTRLLESVLKENKRMGKLLEEKHEEWFELMDEINNQETLSEYWIEQKSIDTHVDTLSGEVQVTFRLDDLQNLLVPKQEVTENQAKDTLEEKGYTIARMYDSDNETVLPYDFYRQVLLAHGYLIIEKPVIPQFVADWLEEYKEDELIITAGTVIGNRRFPKDTKVAKWLNEDYVRNSEVFAQAWLAYPNIEVEEEQKYRVLDGNTTLLGRINGLILTTVEILEYYPEYDPTFEFTEQEIKDYDERYIPFMVPVDEVNND